MKSFDNEQDTYDLIDLLDPKEIEAELQNIKYSSSINTGSYCSERIKNKVFKKIGIKTIRQKKFRIGLKIAAAVLPIIIVATGFIGPGNVWAAIKNVIEYIPGIGIALDKQETTDRYILESPIKIDANQNFVELKGAILDSNRMVISIGGNNPEGPPKDVILFDESGNKYEGYLIGSGGGLNKDLRSSKKIYDWWNASYEFKGNIDKNSNLQLNIDKNISTIAFSLKQAESYKSYEEIGPTVTQNGITITTIALRQGENLKINYITKSEQGNNKKSDYFNTGYPISVPQASLTDKNGYFYKQLFDIFTDSNGITDYNGLYFAVGNNAEKEYKLKIPYVDVYYNGKEKITLDIPEKGEINIDKSIVLAGFPVDIKSVKRINDNCIVLFVDTHYDVNKPESLFSFRASYANNYGINLDSIMSNDYIPYQVTFEDALDKAISDLDKNNYCADFYLLECDYPGHDYLKAILLPIKPEMKTVELNIISPQIAKSGPWEFDIMLD